MTTSRRIERIKNVLIVVLFVTTMLLLYFFWENPMKGTFDFTEIIPDEETVVETLKLTEVISPTETVVHFGGGEYTKLKDRLIWEQTVGALKQIGQDENLIVEEITEEQYQRIMNSRSLWVSFDYSMPFGPFCSAFGIPTQQGFGQIDSFSRLSYSTGSPESLFVYDQTTKKHYRLVSDEYHPDLGPIIEAADGNESGTYYTIGAMIGTENQTVIPLSLSTSLKTLSFDLEFESEDSESTTAFAQTFFGESFDFVRRVEESKGTIIYMYGYGEKILTINSNGTVEYKEKGISSGSRQDYFLALDKAMQFITYHGGWPTIEEGITPFLESSVYLETEKHHGYRYSFGIKSGESIIDDSYGAPIVVEVFGDQVTYYTRNLIKVLEDETLPPGGKEPFSPVNMIAQNYEYMYAALSSQGHNFGEVKEEDRFEVTSNLISSVEAGYLKQDVEGGGDRNLRPVWIVTMGNWTLYFDLFDAEPLGSIKKRDS